MAAQETQLLLPCGSWLPTGGATLGFRPRCSDSRDPLVPSLTHTCHCCLSSQSPLWLGGGPGPCCHLHAHRVWGHGQRLAGVWQTVPEPSIWRGDLFPETEMGLFTSGSSLPASRLTGRRNHVHLVQEPAASAGGWQASQPGTGVRGVGCGGVAPSGPTAAWSPHHPQNQGPRPSRNRALLSVPVSGRAGEFPSGWPAGQRRGRGLSLG